MAAFLAIFLAANLLDIPVLNDPGQWMNTGGISAALVGVGLLVADVLLPVPSSLVMVAHGALFGVWIGALLSLAGSTGATLVGFAIGRQGGKRLDRLVTAEERAGADALLGRWGLLAVVVTRPIPIFAETIAIVAGTSSLGWGTTTLAALAGSAPAAFLYAITGAAIADLQSSALVFGLVVLIAVLIGLGAGGWRVVAGFWQAADRENRDKLRFFIE